MPNYVPEPFEFPEYPVLSEFLERELRRISGAVNNINENLENGVLQGIVSINGGPLNGFRNLVINGDNDIWQRSIAAYSGNGYGNVDRWVHNQVGSAHLVSRQAFAVGQTDVPGNPKYWCRTDGTSVAGAGNYVIRYQFIEDVRTLSGQLATVTFWAKADFAGRKMAVEVGQSFGSGGSPSAQVSGVGIPFTLTTSWQKFTATVQIPSIAGKTLGTNNDHALYIMFWFEAGSTFAVRSGSIGQNTGSWWYDLTRISLVKGDATAEDDPTSSRHIQQEEALCQRYYWKWSPINFHFNFLTGAAGPLAWFFPFHTQMRAIPILSSDFTGATFTNCTFGAWDSPNVYGARLYLNVSPAGGGFLIPAAGNFVAANAEL